MKIKAVYLLSLLFILSACSATPQATRYYLLNSYKSTEMESSQSGSLVERETEVISLSVTLADYLMQPSVVMQIDEHQIHYALFHRWAEPLLSGTEQSLLQDLNARIDHGEFVKAEGGASNTQSSYLHVNVDYFHIGQDSSVILAGHYKFVVPGDTGTADKGVFSFRETLSSDGYEPAIGQMRQLITELSDQISGDLNVSGMD